MLSDPYVAIPTRTSSLNTLTYGFGWRHVLAVLAFFAFFVTYMLRVNINVAIVAMVNQTAIQAAARHSSGNNATTKLAACLANQMDNFTAGLPEEESQKETFVRGLSVLFIAPRPSDVEGKYMWDEKEQGNILSAFFYGYFITQLPGGVIAGIFGPKWVFGLGLLLTSVLTLFTPLAAQAGPGLLMGLRFVEGLGEGVLFPAMHGMLGRWAPPLERSKLPAFIYAGYYVGTVVTFACSGLLAGSSLRWPSIFYISGIIGCIWFVFWTVLSTDTPETHRWISHNERQYIVYSIRSEKSKQKTKSGCCEIPWWSFAKSLPLYAIVISHTFHGWGFYTILIYLPIYLRTILGYDIRQNGLISALPYLLAFIAQLISSWFADFIRSKGWLSTTVVRKIFDISGNFVHAMCLLCVTFVGCDRVAVLVLLTIGVAIASFSTSGFSVNHLDLAPAYAGQLLGISNCIANVTGFLVPLVVGHITENNQTVGAWSTVFYIAIGLELFTCVFYGIFASGEVQPWAKQKEEENDLNEKL